MEQKTAEILENITEYDFVEYLLKTYTKRQLAEQIIMYHNDFILAALEEKE